MTHSSRPTGCRSTAPAPAELASVCTTKVLFLSGNASTAGGVRACLRKWKAPTSPPPQAVENLHAFFDANSLFLGKSVSGSAVRCCNFG